MDFEPIVAAVREIGYDGYFGAEALPYPSPAEAARQTVTKFRELFGS
jgi:sugar phosphate isomerase/epimerase